MRKNKEKSPLLGSNRDTNFEIYRIILLLLIIAHHYVVNSGVMAADGPIAHDPNAKRALLYLTVGAWGQSALNGFALITGYFMCRQRLSPKKYLRLLAEVMFYRLFIAAVFWCVGYEPFSLNALVKAMIPVTNAKDSEIQAVLIVYLCIPILNKLTEALSERLYIGLLMLAGVAYTVCGSFNFMTESCDYVAWFCVVYLLGAYIALYPKKLYESGSFWGIMMICILGVSFASILNCRNRGIAAYTYLNAPYKLLPLCNALSSFLFIRRLRIRRVAAINRVAAATFGVLLIHTAGAPMRRLLWTDLLQVKHFYWASGPVMLLHIAGSVLGVFAVCFVIDLLRARFLERPFNALLDKIGPPLRSRWKNMCVRLDRKLAGQ